MESKFDTSTHHQRNRLLRELRKRALTTLEIRRELDILMPAARVYELRHGEGLNIKLHWVTEMTVNAVAHRVGKYVLHSGKFKGVRNEK